MQFLFLSSNLAKEPPQNLATASCRWAALSTIPHKITHATTPSSGAPNIYVLASPHDTIITLNNS